MDRVVPQLAPGHMILAEQVRSEYVVTVGSGVLIEDLSVPSFWAHHASQLRPYDELVIHPEDGTWYAKYVVLDCSRTWAKVKQLSFVSLTTSDVSMSQAADAELKAAQAAYKVMLRGPHKWSVIRVSDGAVMQQDIQIKGDAEEWLAKHVRDETGIKVAA